MLQPDSDQVGRRRAVVDGQKAELSVSPLSNVNGCDDVAELLGPDSRISTTSTATKKNCPPVLRHLRHSETGRGNHQTQFPSVNQIIRAR